MAPVTRSQSQAEKRKVSPDPAATDDPKKKIRLSPKECPLTLKFLEDLGLKSDFLKSGKVSVAALDPKDPAFNIINTYIYRSFPTTGIGYLKHHQVTSFAITNNMKNSSMDHNDDPKNAGKLRRMVWHGTPTKNVAKILEQGLKMPKYKTDPYFGPGIYFSDSFQYSFGYCSKTYTPLKNGRQIYYVFLSDVLLGNIFKSYVLEPNAPKLKVKKGNGWETVTVESVQGCACKTPDPKGDLVINGCIWPLGAMITDQKAHSNDIPLIPSNEYVVYEAKKAIPKYLVKVELPVRGPKRSF